MKLNSYINFFKLDEESKLIDLIYEFNKQVYISSTVAFFAPKFVVLMYSLNNRNKIIVSIVKLSI